MIKMEMIGGEKRYTVVTHQTHRNMGTYNSKKAAEKRLDQIKKYKYIDKK